MPSFLVPAISSCKFCHMFILSLPNTYTLISYSSNTLAVLICLVNLLLKDALTHTLSKKHSQEFASLPKMCRKL